MSQTKGIKAKTTRRPRLTLGPDAPDPKGREVGALLREYWELLCPHADGESEGFREWIGELRRVVETLREGRNMVDYGSSRRRVELVAKSVFGGYLLPLPSKNWPKELRGRAKWARWTAQEAERRAKQQAEQQAEQQASLT